MEKVLADKDPVEKEIEKTKTSELLKGGLSFLSKEDADLVKAYLKYEIKGIEENQVIEIAILFYKIKKLFRKLKEFKGVPHNDFLHLIIHKLWIFDRMKNQYMAKKNIPCKPSALVEQFRGIWSLES
jgi:hypothetical protein